MTRSSAFFKRIIDRLNHNSKAVVRLNLLRVLRTVCEVHPNRAVLVERYGLLGIVERLSRGDGAVLVRELAREIVPTLKPGLRPAAGRGSGPGGGGLETPHKNGGSGLAPKKIMRRTASETNAMPLGVGGVVGRNGSGGENGLAGNGSSTARVPGKARPRQRLGDIPWQEGGGAFAGGRR